MTTRCHSLGLKVIRDRKKRTRLLWSQCVVRVLHLITFLLVFLLSNRASAQTATPTWNVTWKNTTSDLSIFVSSTTNTGAGWASLENMRSTCQSLATAQGFGGTWYPLASTSTWNAINVTDATSNQTRNIWNMNSQIVATSESDFWDGSIAYELSWAENRTNVHTFQTRPWTGSTTAGYYAAGLTCNDWTSASSAVYGNFGQTDDTIDYMYRNSGACNGSRRIYCIGNYVPPTFTPTPTPSITPTVTPTPTATTTPPCGDTNLGCSLEERKR